MPQTMTALYATRAAAEAARADLLTLGITTDAVAIRGADDQVGTASPTSPEEGGFWSGLADFFMPDEDQRTYAEGVRRGSYLLSVNVPDGLEGQAEAALERSEPLDLEEHAESWRQSGWTEPSAGSSATIGTAAAGVVGTTSSTSGQSLERAAGDKIQLVEEQLQVGKRQVSGGGVRVRTYVKETPVEEQVDLRSERVTIERRPVDRQVGAQDVDFTEKTIEATERVEEAVVAKTARIKEEIGIHKDVETRTETVRDTVRSTDVEIEDTRTGEVVDTGKVVDLDPSTRRADPDKI